jgi:thiol-disulfide isomerase/thioredoxin
MLRDRSGAGALSDVVPGIAATRRPHALRQRQTCVMDNPPRPKHRRLAALALVGAVALVACGSDDDSTSSSAAPDTPAASDGSTTDPGSTIGEPIQENGPVTVTGVPLEPFDSTIPDGSIGTETPVTDGESFDGSPVAIGGTTESPMMYVFLAHWCPHCNDEIPQLIELRDSGALPAELGVVGVSTAVAADRPNYPPSEWIVESGWPWPVMADDEQLTAMASFGGTGFPFTVLTDADGTVLARRAGSATADEISAWVDEALA